MAVIEHAGAWSIRVRGTVQGVGFRPFVYRVATGLGLAGTVRNVDGDVVIEVAGSAAAVAALTLAVREQAPPHAVVTEVKVQPRTAAAVRVGAGFTVVHSAAPAGVRPGFAGLPVDLATCEECLRELFDPADRRFRYPFINCTNCGPRATIVDELPYDRVRTAMAGFPLCVDCSAEYADPGNRRFHAEPLACPACGPRLTWRLDGVTAGNASAPGPEGVAAEGVAAAAATVAGEEAFTAAVAAIGAGRIVALKGLGGYQIACDATNRAAVARLRAGKRRPGKPFAVMVADLAAAEALGHLTGADRVLLGSPARPIVLVPARPGSAIDPGVHPGTGEVGVFLPYTPLHHLLLRSLARPVVVTSGNHSEEPIAIDDTDALTRLSSVVHGFLQHDRPIRARYDDSVVRTIAGRPAMVRRARGYAPNPLPLPIPSRRPVLAVGAQLKHTFTLAQGERALVGPHGGSLDDADALAAFHATLAQLSRLHRFTPEYVAHDRHPGYISTRYALDTVPASRRIPVQHHHAHVVSCAAENGVEAPFIGVAYDGLGLGEDGGLWGGEVLLASYSTYRRLGRFSTAPLPGGEAAVRRPARMALGYLFGHEFPIPPVPCGLLDRIDSTERDAVRRMVARGVNSPRASSAGRLFDAVSSLLGICDEASYEGEAAVGLEAAAARATHPKGMPRGPEAASPLGIPGASGMFAVLPWQLTNVDGLWVYDCSSTLAALLDAAASGEPVESLAAAFHHAIVAVTVALCVRAAERTAITSVCLSGGCLQNRLLATSLLAALAAAGLAGYVNRNVPANDGGISYGQAVVAAARTKEGA